jgi:hypothetical protein
MRGVLFLTFLLALSHFSKAISSVREYTQSHNSAFVLFILWTQLPADQIFAPSKPELRRNGAQNASLSLHRFTEIGRSLAQTRKRPRLEMISPIIFFVAQKCPRKTSA